MKVISWFLEPIRAMFDRLATTDDIALNLRALGWSTEELEAIRMFAQVGGTAEDLAAFSRTLAMFPAYSWRSVELEQLINERLNNEEKHVSAPTYEYHRRYEVQIANTVATISGRDMQGSWNFHFGFHELSDAQAAAERLSEENRWVRVVDTQGTNEEIE